MPSCVECESVLIPFRCQLEVVPCMYMSSTISRLHAFLCRISLHSKLVNRISSRYSCCTAGPWLWGHGSGALWQVRRTWAARGSSKCSIRPPVHTSGLQGAVCGRNVALGTAWCLACSHRGGQPAAASRKGCRHRTHHACTAPRGSTGPPSWHPTTSALSQFTS